MGQHTLIELDVRLREIEPPIWRTIEIAGTASLSEVHFAIQVAMGWTNSHLHLFQIGGTEYGMVDPDGADELELEDDREFRLQDLVGTGASFVYLYDFGDSWEHDVTVKKVSTVAKAPRPRCTAGARACPPEDCGGWGGYANLLDAISNPKHEEHQDMVRWAGDFRPEKLAMPKAGRELRHEIDALVELANGDGAEMDDALLAIPEPLMNAVLELDPMTRASLGALIAASLATELTELRMVVGSLEVQQRDAKAARNGRKRARS